MTGAAEGQRGAYGLSLPSLEAQQWLNPAPEGWTEWMFVHRAEAPSPRPEAAEGLAVVKGEGGRAEYIDRHAATTTLVGGAPVPADLLVHPVLGTTAATYAHWRSMLTFHSGAFLTADRGVWGLLGDREQGKSTLLAWMAHNGHEVFADDLLVTDGERVLSGPRCVDLRETSAQRLGLGHEVGGAGLRRRWRIGLPPVVAEAPLHGWVVLEWGQEVRMDDISAQQRADWLTAAVGLRVSDQPPLPWLNVLAKPMVLLTRPPTWETMDVVLARLLDRVDGAYR